MSEDEHQHDAEDHDHRAREAQLVGFLFALRLFPQLFFRRRSH